MGLRLGYGLGLTNLRASGGGAGPVNLAAPEITGLLTQGSDKTLDIGLWGGTAATFRIRVRQTSPDVTLVDWTPVTGTSTGTFDEAVGSSLILDVEASTAGGATTVVSSDPFGPIEADGDTWIIGLVLNGDSGHNPTPSGAPVTYTRLGPSAESGMAYDAGQGWGWIGTTATTLSGQTRTDARLAGRWSNNVNMGATGMGIRIDLPEPGVYIIHAGFGASSTVSPRLLIRETDPDTGSILHQINTSSAITATSTQTMDIAGNVRTHADWTAESDYGGSPVEITVTGTSLFIGRPGTSGAPHLNYIGVLKKAA